MCPAIEPVPNFFARAPIPRAAGGVSHGEPIMSRAFVNEDAGGWETPGRSYGLPPRDDPSFDEAAARTLLEAARVGDTGSAESATGYYWGEPKLQPHVRRILERARAERDERLTQLAERFLR